MAGDIADHAASTVTSGAVGASARHWRPNLTSARHTTHVTDYIIARVRLHERALSGGENRRHHRHET